MSYLASVDLQTRPFPHLTAENLLPPETLPEIERHWPDAAQFIEGGIDGNMLFDFARLGSLPQAQQDFWRGFLRGTVADYLGETARWFAPFYTAKFGGVPEGIRAWVMLQEMAPNFSGHEIHTHHYHSPNWLFSTLLYIDGEGSPGTSLYTTRQFLAGDASGLAKVAAQTLQWDDMPDMVPQTTIGIKPNRYLAFLDMPASFHGVARPDSPAPGRTRRIIRAHVMAPESTIEQVYGMRPARYGVLRRRASRDPAVIAMLNTEIGRVLSAGQATPHGAKIRVAVPG